MQFIKCTLEYRNRGVLNSNDPKQHLQLLSELDNIALILWTNS